MTLDELKIELRNGKLETFDYLRIITNLDRADLDNAGYKNKTNAEALKIILDKSIENMEKKIKKWEKDNPD